MSEKNHFSEGFILEAHELLAEVEAAVLDIEDQPEDFEVVNRLFRAMHTIKGSGAMFGFERIAEFTHHVESAMDKVREGLVPVTGELIDQILLAKDHIRDLLEAGEMPEQGLIDRGAPIVQALKTLVPREAAEETPADPLLPSPEPDGDEVTASYRIRYTPCKETFLTGMDPLLLIDELGELGDCLVSVETDAVPELSVLDPESFYLAFDITLTSDCGLNAVKDVFIFVEGDSEVSISLLQEHFETDAEKPVPKIGQILVDRGDLKEDAVEQVHKEQKRIGELLVEKGKVSKDKINAALQEQKALKAVKAKGAQSSVRVPSGRLDTLINLVGELVITQAWLTQVAGNIDHPELGASVEEVERLTNELRDNVLNIRMMPIGTSFNKFRRLVRDLSAELGKEISLTTSGAETEMDKTVLERLDDPLVHLIRNSIDHGIETADIREAAGKPAQGTIRLSAAHLGTNVLITIQDDGQGLDEEKIRQKAREKGLIPENDDLGPKEIFNLIFAPGFSTAQNVTSVSGRGVGMDVVKKTIEGLRGNIEIDSAPGRGTTIELRLPLTLAIINGLLVTIGDEPFVLPLMSVEECVEMKKADLSRTPGRNILNIRGEVVPYIRLRDHFGMAEGEGQIEHIVIGDVNGRRTGFVVDRVIGGHQTVIKSLGAIFRDIKDISGATILGDGTVALILDINVLLESAVLKTTP